MYICQKDKMGSSGGLFGFIFLSIMSGMREIDIGGFLESLVLLIRDIASTVVSVNGTSV